MKTQTILSISLALLMNAFILNGFATEKKPHGEAIHLNLIYQADMESSEEALELEDWMTDDSCWEINAEETKLINEDQESEEHLAIESWMTDDNLWRL